MLACWSFCTGRTALAGALDRVAEANRLADVIASHARRSIEARAAP
jgi:hypothetical protein